MAGRRRYLIVDGHSLIHAWPDLRALHHRQPRAAREELVRRLTVLHDRGESSVVVVFDGNGPRATTSRDRPVDMQIVYSGRGATADAVIERLVGQYASEHELTVATADEGERLAVSGLGAWWMSADALREACDAAQRTQEKTLGRLRGRGSGFRLGDQWE